MKTSLGRFPISLGLISRAMVLIGVAEDSDSRHCRDVAAPIVLYASPMNGAIHRVWANRFQ